MGENTMQLNTDDLIGLSKNGKITGMYWDDDEQCHFPIEIELDDMAKAVLVECAYMLNFERDCYLKGKKKNGR